MAEDSVRKRVRVSGIAVHTSPHEQVLEEIQRNITSLRARCYICITNTESMYHARRIPAHWDYIEQADFSLCDGVGVVIAGRLQGHRIERFNGPVLMLEACQHGVPEGWRHFFCGGKEGVAERLAAALAERIPGIVCCGTYCPPFRAMSSEEEQQMLATIQEARPDVLWVGLGLLKQEAWIARHRNSLDIPWIAGVGAAFDFHAGTARWAPPWVQRIGMEWLYRLYFEPRMFKRVMLSFVFLFEAARDAYSGKA